MNTNEFSPANIAGELAETQHRQQIMRLMAAQAARQPMSIRVDYATNVCECRACGAVWQGSADQHTSEQCATFQAAR